MMKSKQRLTIWPTNPVQNSKFGFRIKLKKRGRYLLRFLIGIYLFARVGMTSKGVNRFFIFEICLPDRMNKKWDDKKSGCMDIGLTHFF